MATPQAKQTSLPITEATPANIASLTTIVARSFHPVNPFIKKCLPDTPQMRQWWARGFTDSFASADAHILTALDASGGDHLAAGVLTCRFMGPEERGAGIWTRTPVGPDDDHDRAMYAAIIENMTVHRERLMLGRRHLCIELFGVDQRYQGRGVGGRLLQRACELADDVGLETFVQANASAKDFYCKLGFVVDEMVVMPGEEAYTEYLLVRPARAKHV